MRTTAGDYLSQAALLRLLAALALVLAPHFTRLPVWISALIVAIGLWRAAAALRQWPLPPGWLKVMASVVLFAAVYASFGRINGQHAGVALLATMLALKLTEMRARRDVLVVVALCYFVMVTHFLFSQELWTILYLFGCAVAVTAVLIEANHAGGPLPPRVTLRLAGTYVLQALPLMLLLFVLFPRVPGPLWGLPADAGASRSGLTDSMSPGDISRMVGSDEVAFRVTMLEGRPPVGALYWRGPVFTHFNGRRWSAFFNGDDYFVGYRRKPRDDAYEDPQAELYGEPVRYEMLLEPHRQHWLLALDIPSPDALPPDSALTGYYQLVSRQLIRDLYRYEMVSYPRYRLSPELSEDARRNSLRLPPRSNPRTLELIRSWRAQGLDEDGIIRRALDRFREEDFVYTLEPPALGEHMVDEFLFESKRGFCEHYAGAFVVMMRAAGIPARVVAGYMGGEYNALGGYTVVRQYDAHAWTEVWRPGRGWVRVDPTAAVAPGRIESGISAAVRSEELPGFLRRGEGLGLVWQVRLRLDTAWDMVNVAWDRWVLAYSPSLQREFLARFGIDDWTKMVLVLTFGIVGVSTLLGLLLLRQLRPLRARDRALELWRQATRELARRGIVQGAAEGPDDFARRVAGAWPELAEPVRRLADAYLAARYLGDDPAADASQLALAARALRR